MELHSICPFVSGLTSYTVSHAFSLFLGNHLHSHLHNPCIHSYSSLWLESFSFFPNRIHPSLPVILSYHFPTFDFCCVCTFMSHTKLQEPEKDCTCLSSILILSCVMSSYPQARGCPEHWDTTTRQPQGLI